MPEIAWASSADDHGISREDAIHAVLNAWYHLPSFDEPRTENGIRPDLWIGPPKGHVPGDDLIEVIAEVHPATRRLFIFHVMPARQKMLALFE